MLLQTDGNLSYVEEVCVTAIESLAFGNIMYIFCCAISLDDIININIFTYQIEIYLVFIEFSSIIDLELMFILSALHNNLKTIHISKFI